MQLNSELAIDMCFAKRNIGSTYRSFDNLIPYHHRRYSVTIQNSATDLYVTRSREPLSLTPSSEEAVIHMECKTELAISEKSQLTADSDRGSWSAESLVDGMESEAVTLCKPNIAITLVLEIEAVESINTPIDCSQEGGPVDNSYIDNVSVTGCCCINWSVGQNETVSVEEVDTNTNECSGLVSVERSTPQSTLNTELAFKEVRPFISDDDGTSHYESTFGTLPSGKINYNYSDLSFKSKIAGLADGYCEKDMAQKSHDHHQLMLPCTVDGQVKSDGLVVSGIVI